MKNWRRIPALLLALVMSLSLLTPAFAAGLPFADVPADAWYRNDVAAIYQTGIFNGTTSTSFDPDGILTHGQAIAIAARLHQYVHEGRITLQNGAGQWYSTYVDYAIQNKLVSFGGIYDGYWDDYATRNTVVWYLSRTMDPDSYTEINTVADDAIPDVKCGDVYSKEIYSFYRAGILTGDAKGYFKPKSYIKRSEMAAILARMLDPAKRKSVTMSEATEFGVDLPTFGQAPVSAVTEDWYCSEAGIMAMLDTYDPDGAWIVRAAMMNPMGMVTTTLITGDGVTTSDDGGTGDLMFYFLPQSFSREEHLTTAVHEECHKFQAIKTRALTSGGAVHNIYTGSGNYMIVQETQTFNSDEMSVLIPDSLRTFRFHEYLGSAAASNQGTRVQGVYGMLDEFSAYYWGANNTFKVATGYKGLDRSQALSGMNDCLPYAEFRFYILRYMLYAKEHYPDIYQGILENSEFRSAFSTIDSLYSNLIQSCGGCSYSDYLTLTTEMQKPEYVQMAALLQP